MKKTLFYLSMAILMAFTSCQTNIPASIDESAPAATQESSRNDSIKYAVLTHNDRLADYCWSLQIPNDEKEGVEVLLEMCKLLKDFNDYSYYSFERSSLDLEYPIMLSLGEGGWELICIKRENFDSNYTKYYFKKSK